MRFRALELTGIQFIGTEYKLEYTFGIEGTDVNSCNSWRAYRILQRRAPEAVDGVRVRVLVLHQPLDYTVTPLRRGQVPAWQ